MGPGEPATTGKSGPRELSLRETAREGEVIVATARRCWRDGELTGAKRNSLGHVRVPGLSAAALRRAKRERPVGLSQQVVSDALWLLRWLLAFARANGLVPAGFDPTEGLNAPTPDAVAAQTRQPKCQPRPLSCAECGRIAAHLLVLRLASHQTDHVKPHSPGRR